MRTNFTYGVAALFAVGGLRSTYLFASNRRIRLALRQMILSDNRGFPLWFPPEMKRLAVRAACFRLTTAAALFMSAYLLYLWAQRNNEIIDTIASIAPIITLPPAPDVPLIFSLSMPEEPYVQPMVEDVVGDSCAVVVAEEIPPRSDAAEALLLVVEEDPVLIVAEKKGEVVPTQEEPAVCSTADTQISDEEFIPDDNSTVSSESDTVFSYWWDCKEGEEPFDNLGI
ncbi:MAG: hypothetical protein QG604_541 [Candidatus Dependentiae bacterium]|nr:hypothetical protein [Candidatus Dependentiae bacterium]